MPPDDLLRLRIVPPVRHDLGFAIDVFLTAKEAKRCTDVTLKHYRWTLERFTAWLIEHGITTADGITAHHIRTFLAELQRNDASSWTVHDFARVIKTFVRFLHTEEMIPTNPFARVEMPVLDDEILPAFDVADVQSLLEACKTDRNRAIVLVLLDTGVRVSELVHLNIGDVNTKTGAVMVRKGKGRKDRMTFLGARSRRVLFKYLTRRGTTQTDDPLFITETTSQRLTVNGLQTMIHRLGERAGVEHCHPHTFRRTFALWSLRVGMNIYALQKIMGHSDLTILRKYLALVQEDLQQAHRQHGAVDNML